MQVKDSATGLAHLSKTAFPLIGRVGTIAGGVFSLLAIFETISGEIVTTLSAFALTSAFIASAVVVFHKTTRTVDETITIQDYSYSRRARVIAAILMTIAGALLLGLTIQFSGNLIKPLPRDRNTPAAKQPSRPPVTLPAKNATTTSSPPPRTPPPTSTFTPAPPTRTLTVTPFPIDQMTDVNNLNKLGKDALSAQNHSAAITYFARALQVDATNAQAQLGLGMAYFYLNNFNAAFSPLRTALQLNPALNEAHAYLGFVYDYRADYVRARAEYEEFLRVAAREHALRAEIADRLKKLSGTAPYPTLTPQMTATPSLNAPTK